MSERESFLVMQFQMQNFNGILCWLCACVTIVLHNLTLSQLLCQMHFAHILLHISKCRGGDGWVLLHED